MIALAIAFYEYTCNVCLDVTKSSAHNYQQYSCKQHLGCTFHVLFGHHHSTGLLHMKNAIFYTMGLLQKPQLKLERN